MTEDRKFRILIVDDQRDVTRVLRASLELMDRGYVIVDVPSGEEAMLEMSGSPFDLVVADYLLPGMTGAEFLKRSAKRMPEAKNIVITGHKLADVRQNLDEADVNVENVFEKPLDMQAFTTAIETLLHGDEARPASEDEKPSPLPRGTGPLRSFDERPIALVMGSLMADLNAQAIAFLAKGGNILLTQGEIDEDLRFSELAVLLAYNLNSTAEISEYLGEGPSGAVHYYDGKDHDIFVLSVGFHFFLTIIYPGNNQRQMGVLMNFAKPAVERIIESLGPEAYATPEGIVPPQIQTAVEEHAAQDEADKVAVAEKPVDTKAKPDELQDEGEEDEDIFDFFGIEADEAEEAPTIDLNMDDLVARTGELPDIDDYWDEAAADASAADDDALSLDDAKKLGIIDIGEEEK